MRTTLLLSTLILFACAYAARAPREPAAAAAGTAQDAAGHYSNEGLSFDYPAGWTVEEKGDAETQRVVVRRAGGTAFVEVASPRPSSVKPKQSEAARESLWDSSTAELGRMLGVKKFPSKDEHKCPPFGERPGSGVSLSGRFEGRGAKGEVYGMYDGGRYLNVSFFRTDGEEREANAALKTVLETLKAEGGGGKKTVLGVVANGRALSKPQPDYPKDLKGAGVGGQVTVQLTVDEKGDVIEARAVSGEPLLRPAAEAAGLRAKYTPTTLCGRPVKVSAVITYTFRP